MPDAGPSSAGEVRCDRDDLFPQGTDASQLGLDVGQALRAGLGVALDRPLGLVERVGRRAVQLLGAGGELVPELALHAPDRISRVLADFERELVGVLAMRVLRLRPALRQRAVLLVAVRL